MSDTLAMPVPAGVRSSTMHDVDVRRHLHTFLDDRFSYDPSTVLLDELGIRQGQVRVDVAAVNGDLYGYEIKAAADTLKRLENQIKSYSLVLDFAAVVVASNHLKAARGLLPRWWGIYEAKPNKGEMLLKQRRRPRRNPELDVRALAELLWHRDTLEMLEARSACRGVKSKPRRFAWDRLCEVYSTDEIRDAVRQRIKARSTRRSARPRG